MASEVSFKERFRNIYSMTDLAIIRAERASRRRTITKSMKKVMDILNRPDPMTVPLPEVTKLISICEDSIALHEALQNKFEERCNLEPDVSEAVRKEEIAADQTVTSKHEDFLEDSAAGLLRVKYSQQGTIIMEDLRRIKDMDDLTVPSMVSDITSIKSRVDTYLSESVSLSSHAFVGDLRQCIKDELHSISARQVQEYKDKIRESPVMTTPPEATSYTPPSRSFKNSLRLNLELPKFSGNPIDWHDFEDLFVSSIRQHADDLSDPEKCCLLLNSMKTDDTRRIVRHYKSGSNGFHSAMKALADAYGRASTIYPHHVRSLLAPIQYNYTRESLRAMQEKYEISMRNLELLKGDNLQTFLSAVLMDQLDSTMLHEWTAYNPYPDSLPTAKDLIKFFHQRERQLVDKTVVERLNQPRKPQQSSSRVKSQPALKVQATNKFQCPVCTSSHPLARCPSFLKFDPTKRQQVVRTHGHCYNCLAFNHSVGDCTSSHTC